MKHNFFTYQTSFLHPINFTLHTQGINVNAIIHKCQLRHFNIKESENYIPSFVVYEFLEEIKNTIGESILFNSDCRNYGLNYSGGFGNYIKTRPSLGEALKEFISLSRTIQTNLHSYLNIGKRTSTFTFEFCDTSCTGKRIAEHSTFMMLLNLFRTYCSTTSEKFVLFVPYHSINQVSQIVNRRIKVIGHQEATYRILFPNRLLKEKSKSTIQLDAVIKPKYKEMNVVDIVSKVIKSYKPGYLPSLQKVSRHFNVSRTTIWRVLFAQQTCFTELLENILLTKATQLLQISDMNVIMISEYLGYSESSNFIRSFKKWAGKTPIEYREGILV